MEVNPSFLQSIAKSEFSETNPYPGCISSQPSTLAAEIILSVLRYFRWGKSSYIYCFLTLSYVEGESLSALE